MCRGKVGGWKVAYEIEQDKGPQNALCDPRVCGLDGGRNEP